MWSRKKESDIEMSGMMDPSQTKKKTKAPSGPPEETEYQKFDWKRFFLAPKYIRKSSPAPLPVARAVLTRKLAWHILFIVIGIITVIITVKHDEVVEACSSPHCFVAEPGHVTNKCTETTTLVGKGARPASRMVNTHCHLGHYFLPAAFWPRDYCAAVRCRLWTVDRFCHCCGGYLHWRR